MRESYHVSRSIFVLGLCIFTVLCLIVSAISSVRVVFTFTSFWQHDRHDTKLTRGNFEASEKTLIIICYITSLECSLSRANSLSPTKDVFIPSID